MKKLIRLSILGKMVANCDHEGNLIYDIISYFIGSCIPYSDDAKIQKMYMISYLYILKKLILL